MNDYFADWPTREHRADLMRPVLRDELAAEFHRSTQTPDAPASRAGIHAGARWRHLVAHLAPSRLKVHGHHG